MKKKQKRQQNKKEVIIIESLTVVAVIIAVVKVVKDYLPQLHGLGTVLLASGLGLVAGYLGLEGLTVQSGLMVGLSAVGVVTVVRSVK